MTGKWIKSAQALPDESEEVLIVFHNSGMFAIAYWEKTPGGRPQWYVSNYEAADVPCPWPAEWMELPDEPDTEV